MLRVIALFLLLSAGVAYAEEKPFYLTLEPPPAPELSPAEALAAFSIAPGFKVELVASKPLVEDPVAIAWDEFGQLYVAEMRGFMPDAWGNGEDEPVGVVVRLKDNDGDGRFDEREVLLDGLVLPRAVAIVNEGLLIGEPPNLWLCPTDSEDSNGISCSNKVRLAEYGNQPGSVEHAENGLLPAVDNWIYNAKSERRFKLSGRTLVEDKTLFRGQWGITQDNFGNLYYNTNSNLLLGDLYDAQPVISAGNKTAAGLNIPVSKNDQLFAVRVNPGVNRAYVPGVLREDGRLDKPTSASGMAVYRGHQFPKDLRGHVFVAEPAANAVAQLSVTRGELEVNTEHVLYPDEKWQLREFLASTDERFRPVDVETGPDGALYVVDMYRGIIQDHVFLSDELRAQALERQLDKPVGMGRIWRVVASNEPVEAPGEFNNADLVALLKHPNGWHRDVAQRLLVDSPEKDVDTKLRNLVVEAAPVTAVHALWILDARQSLDTATLQSALARESADLQLAAMRAGERQLSKAALLDLAGSPDKGIAHQATMYLSRFSEDNAVISFLAVKMSQDPDPVQLMGIQVAAAGNELALVRALPRPGVNEFVASLVSQVLRRDASQAGALLDAVLAEKEASTQRAMLDGLIKVTRTEEFERVLLAGPHVLFTEAPDELWPVIAKLRQGFTWPGDDLVAGAKPLSPAEAERMEAGKQYFLERCAICHRADGMGIASLGPPLVESEWVTGPSEPLIRIILHGLQGPITVKGEEWNGVMPGHNTIPDFTDDVASGLLTYLGRAWGHTGRIIQPAFVKEVRELEAGRAALWTSGELSKLEINTHYRALAGVYGGGPFELTLTYNGEGLEIGSVYFNGQLQETAEDEFLFAPRQLKLIFNRDAGHVTGITLPEMDGAVLSRVSGP